MKQGRGLIIIFVMVVALLHEATGSATTFLPYYDSKIQQGFELAVEDSISNAGFYQYSDNLFGYNLDIPKEFNYIVLISGNSASTIIAYPKKNAVLHLSGHYVYTRSMQEEYRQRINALGKQVAYSNSGSDYYVISWIEPGDGFMRGEMIHYKKVFFNEKYYNQFELVYPSKERTYFNSNISVMEKSFVPGWKTGNKIWG